LLASDLCHEVPQISGLSSRPTPKATSAMSTRKTAGALSGGADGAPVLAAGQHALGLALHLPYALARDSQLVA
jgi:hypothetical protein